MPIKPFSFIPKDIIEWSRFFKAAEVTPDDGSITDATFGDRAANSIIGRPQATGGKPSDITFGADGRFVVRRAGVVVTDALIDADIPSGIARDTEVSGAITTALASYLTQAQSDARYLQIADTWRTVRKSTDETKTSNSTLANDATLKFAMLANTTYVFRMQVIFLTSAAADFKWRHSGPAAPIALSITRRQIIAGGTSISTIAEDSAYSSLDISMLASTGIGVVWMEGVISNGATAGDFNFEWSQNTSDASNTTVLAGSWIEWM